MEEVCLVLSLETTYGMTTLANNTINNERI